MRIIKVHNEIANKMAGWVFCYDGEEDTWQPFSLDYLQKQFEQYPEENDWKFNIHCIGGDVEEGLAIYDYLRTSGKNIYCNIEGSCHSMAVVILLAAPKENRSANPNALSLIHQVSGGVFGTTEDVQETADLMAKLQKKILNIYADRTDLEYDECERIMNEQTEHSVAELLEWGFISKINDYNTNTYKNSIMAKNEKKSLFERTKSFLNRGKIKNYKFVSPEGEELFTTEAEDDTLEVGMKATPDGTFTLEDGRVITIEGGEITKIDEFNPEEESPEEMAEHIEELEKENDELKKELEESNKALNEAKSLLNEYQSTYEPKNRVQLDKKAPASATREERKNAIREKLTKK